MPRLKRTPKRFALTIKKKPTVPKPPKLPMMVCVICYNEFTSYTLNCMEWETEMTKDFYVALNIPSGDQDDESIVSLPFCPECHSKVSIMFSVHQQIQTTLQNFNCIRNNLAFTVVETIAKNCRNGPLDLIRQQIYDRWNELHTKAKESNNAALYDGGEQGYLDQTLTKLDDYPRDPVSMMATKNNKILKSRPPGQPQRRVSNLAIKRDETTNEFVIEDEDEDADTPEQSTSSSVNTGPSVKKPGIQRRFLKSPRSKNPEMPVLIPMGKISTPPPAHKKIPEPVIRRPYVRKLLTFKPAAKRQLIKIGKQKLMQKSSKVALAKLQPGSKTKMIKRLKFKPPKALKDGTFQCAYCPKTYAKMGMMQRHVNGFHPTIRQLECHVCLRGFSNRMNLRRHLETVHQQAVEGFAKCPLCPKSYSRKYAYDFHVRTAHKNESPPSVKSGPTILKVKIPKVSPPSPEITEFETRVSPVAVPNGIADPSAASANNALPLKRKRRSTMTAEDMPGKKVKTDKKLKTQTEKKAKVQTDQGLIELQTEQNSELQTEQESNVQNEDNSKLTTEKKAKIQTKQKAEIQTKRKSGVQTRKSGIQTRKSGIQTRKPAIQTTKPGIQTKKKAKVQNEQKSELEAVEEHESESPDDADKAEAEDTDLSISVPKILNGNNSKLLNGTSEGLDEDTSSKDSISKSHECPFCMLVFPEEDLLEAHMESHEENESAAAEVGPDAETPTKGKKTKLKMKMVQVSNGMFSCEICGKLCNKKQGLVGHMKAHRKSSANKSIAVNGTGTTN